MLDLVDSNLRPSGSNIQPLAELKFPVKETGVKWRLIFSQNSSNYAGLCRPLPLSESKLFLIFTKLMSKLMKA